MSLTCHSQPALPQQSSIFTTCLSCVFLPWHFLLVHTPAGGRGHGLCYPCTDTLLPQQDFFIPLWSFYQHRGTHIKICVWICDCMCVNVNALWAHSVSWQPLPLAGKLSCGTQCRSIQAALLPHWVVDLQGFDLDIPLSWSEILVPFLFYCTVILVNKTRTTLCD